MNLEEIFENLLSDDVDQTERRKMDAKKASELESPGLHQNERRGGTEEHQ